MINDELKPCPFCGGEAELRFFNNGSSFSYRVECLNCTAMVGRRFAEYSTNRTFWFGIKQEAIEAWNQRAERTCDDIGYDSFVCSKCGFDCYVNSKQYGLCIPDYCPECGAKVVE